MKHKLPITLLGVFVLLISILSFVYLKHMHDTRLPDDLYKKFGCDRISLDARYTDKYCENYKLYKQDHAAGKI